MLPPSLPKTALPFRAGPFAPLFPARLTPPPPIETRHPGALFWVLLAYYAGLGGVLFLAFHSSAPSWRPLAAAAIFIAAMLVLTARFSRA